MARTPPGPTQGHELAIRSGSGSYRSSLTAGDAPMKLPVHSLLAELLDGNAWDALGEGRFCLPERMLDDLLGQLSMPDPIDRVRLVCRPGHLLLRVRIDLRSKGVRLTPEVEQVFELEQARIDPIGRFVVLRPQGGLQLVESSLGMRSLPPMAKLIMGRIVHTPTLLALVRDRFPRQLSYEHGRLHIGLGNLSVLDRVLPIGDARVPLLDVLTVRNMRVETGRVVVRVRFDKEALLTALRSPRPEEGAVDRPPVDDRMPAPPANMPPPSEGAAETALRLGKRVGSVGARVLGRAFRR